MKNIILGMIGFLMTVYLLLISLNVYSVITETNKMEGKVSRVLQNCMEDFYHRQSDSAHAQKQLTDEILQNEKPENVSIRITKMDLEKGLLRVVVEKKIPLITGSEKHLKIDKTVIMERQNVQPPQVRVSFYCGDRLYKQYELAVGESCPIPSFADETDTCWLEQGLESQGAITELDHVYEDRVFYAGR